MEWQSGTADISIWSNQTRNQTGNLQSLEKEMNLKFRDDLLMITAKLRALLSYQFFLLTQVSGAL